MAPSILNIDDVPSTHEFILRLGSAGDYRHDYESDLLWHSQVPHPMSNLPFRFQQSDRFDRLFSRLDGALDYHFVTPSGKKLTQTVKLRTPNHLHVAITASVTRRRRTIGTNEPHLQARGIGGGA